MNSIPDHCNSLYNLLQWVSESDEIMKFSLVTIISTHNSFLCFFTSDFDYLLCASTLPPSLKFSCTTYGTKIEVRGQVEHIKHCISISLAGVRPPLPSLQSSVQMRANTKEKEKIFPRQTVTSLLSIISFLRIHFSFFISFYMLLCRYIIWTLVHNFITFPPLNENATVPHLSSGQNNGGWLVKNDEQM